MELKEYIEIFRKNFKIWIYCALAVVFLASVYHGAKAQFYKSSLTINVTRSSSQETDEYKFDNYYRLQADEQFSDTIVRWLSSPSIVIGIFDEAEIELSERVSHRKLAKKFKARRLSAQVISVDYASGSTKDAEKIADSVIKVLNKQTGKLNKDQKDKAWFKVIGDTPVIVGGKASFSFVLVISVLIGGFIGFWAVLLKHYLKE